MFGIFPNMRPRSSKTVQFILVYSNLVVKFEELNFDGDVTCKYNTAAMMWSHNQRLFFLMRSFVIMTQLVPTRKSNLKSWTGVWA